MVQHALALAAKGARVFPLVPGTKEPAIPEWQKKATLDPILIAKVWGGRDYNIGVATGNGLLGLDVDVKKGKPGLASLMALDLSFDELDTFTVRTCSGGYHYYFKTDVDVTNSAGRLGVGLDVRGAGGYLVGPGSIVDGVLYVVEHEAAYGPAPLCVTSRLQGAMHRDTKLPLVDLDQEAAIERGIAYLALAPLAVEYHGGDLTTYKVASRLKDFGLSETTSLELMVLHWNDRCLPGWQYEDLEKKVGNAYAYGSRSPGAAHPDVDFKGVVRIDEPIIVRAPARWVRHGDAWDRNAAWLYHELLTSAGVCLLVGPSQSGKSFLALELARSLATGKPFFGIEPDEKGATLMVFAGTEGGGLSRRMDALGEVDRLPISAIAVGSLSDAAAISALEADLLAESIFVKATFDLPVRLIVLETLAASGLIRDENDNAEASRALVTLAALGRRLNALFIVSHHPPKDGKGARGAGALLGSADVVLEISRIGTEPVRDLAVVKAREAEQRQLGSFTLTTVVIGEDYKGRPVKSLTVSMGAPKTHAEKMFKHASLLAECIEWALVDQAVMIDGESFAPKSAIWPIFKERCTSIADEGHRNGALNKAILALAGAGRTVVVTYEGEKHFRMKEAIQ